MNTGPRQRTGFGPFHASTEYPTGEREPSTSRWLSTANPSSTNDASPGFAIALAVRVLVFGNLERPFFRWAAAAIVSTLAWCAVGPPKPNHEHALPGTHDDKWTRLDAPSQSQHAHVINRRGHRTLSGVTYDAAERECGFLDTETKDRFCGLIAMTNQIDLASAHRMSSDKLDRLRAPPQACALALRSPFRCSSGTRRD